MSCNHTIALNLEQFNRSEWINNIRALATTFVVMVHAAMGDRNQDHSPELLYSSFGRFCVPFFLMLTGALLIDKNYLLVDFLKKNFCEFLSPLFFGVYSISERIL